MTLKSTSYAFLGSLQKKKTTCGQPTKLKFQCNFDAECKGCGSEVPVTPLLSMKSTLGQIVTLKFDHPALTRVATSSAPFAHAVLYDSNEEYNLYDLVSKDQKHAFVHVYSLYV